MKIKVFSGGGTTHLGSIVPRSNYSELFVGGNGANDKSLSWIRQCAHRQFLNLFCSSRAASGSNSTEKHQHAPASAPQSKPVPQASQVFRVCFSVSTDFMKISHREDWEYWEKPNTRGRIYRIKFYLNRNYANSRLFIFIRGWHFLLSR